MSMSPPTAIGASASCRRATAWRSSSSPRPRTTRPSLRISKVADFNLCATRCVSEFGNPCQNFCPANVYEMIDDGKGGKRLQINASNCVHCKSCDIKEPYTDQITWVTPEGGSGPNYQSL
jgi:ferredoxin-like protein FixX